MSVRLMPVPDHLRAAFLITARNLFHKDAALLADLEARPANLYCLPMFTLTCDDLLHGHRLEAARPAGYRLLFLSADHVLAGDALSGKSAVARISSLSRSPQLRDTIEIVLGLLAGAHLDPELDYEIRLLRISSTYLEACWLSSPRTDADRLVPTISGLKRIETRASYAPDAVFEAASQVASEIKATGGNQP